MDWCGLVFEKHGSSAPSESPMNKCIYSESSICIPPCIPFILAKYIKEMKCSQGLRMVMHEDSQVSDSQYFFSFRYLSFLFLPLENSPQMLSLEEWSNKEKRRRGKKEKGKSIFQMPKYYMEEGGI